MSLGRLYSLNTADPIWENRIQQVVQKIRSVSQECDIWMFGSFVRQQFRSCSDLDFAIVTNEDPKMLRIALHQQLPYTDWPVDMLILTRERFEKMKDIGGVCFDIFHEGKKMSEGQQIEGLKNHGVQS